MDDDFVGLMLGGLSPAKEAAVDAVELIFAMSGFRYPQVGDERDGAWMIYLDGKQKVCSVAKV